MTLSSFNTCDGTHFHLGKEFHPHNDLHQKSILNVIFLHVCLPSQLHEKTGEEHLTAILDMKLMI